MYEQKLNIALLLNTNKTFERKIIEGIGQYIQSTKINWTVHFEEDLQLANIKLKDFVVMALLQVLITSKWKKN